MTNVNLNASSQRINRAYTNTLLNSGPIDGKDWSYMRARDGRISREDAIGAFTSDEYAKKYADIIKAGEDAKSKAIAEESANAVAKAKKLAELTTPTKGEPGGPRMISDAFVRAEEIAKKKAGDISAQSVKNAKKSKIITGIAVALAVVCGILGFMQADNNKEFSKAA